MYGMCYFCGEYKFNIEQVNGRFCSTCHRRIADRTKAYNKKGGMFKADPFWINMRKKLGKDWMTLMRDGSQNNR